ncbi:hypothetical protein [Streptomyces acidiscabies]|uniref:Uncharacterized protein n=1 Tax=Streptomyces acidiscabies TaxID=42234 RepID=A0AAP6BJ68_9ACTN|nr:hypothetical protein [Streptomyces acidiscabies]MBZ3909207.1 hypothetical protein [Streptomyces acidiscabies]MDX2965741.1 hypothetical protein [Streptomyces acidiscabies]MDX3016386.1 hypothetical protein [Streptomyces acidiscabies]MDX3788708.1 hypothetical protein [Streptomyces acidiscabies]
MSVGGTPVAWSPYRQGESGAGDAAGSVRSAHDGTALADGTPPTANSRSPHGINLTDGTPAGSPT